MRYLRADTINGIEEIEYDESINFWLYECDNLDLNLILYNLEDDEVFYFFIESETDFELLEKEYGVR